jgi:peptidoglycan/LPS O-acetylase OafA/YrhL
MRDGRPDAAIDAVSLNGVKFWDQSTPSVSSALGPLWSAVKAIESHYTRRLPNQKLSAAPVTKDVIPNDPGELQATAAAATRPSRRIEYLDGVRALAALWVVVSHIWITQFGLTVHSGLIGKLTNWTLYSHLAVDVFIVLSGFCLILPRLAKAEQQFDAVNFYYRRARRILPPYYCALALGILVSVFSRHALTGGWSLNIANVAANLFLIQDALISRDTFNGPLWSVAVEWRIYFLFPLIVGLLFRFGRWSVLVFTGLVGYLITAAIMRWEPTMLLSCPWYLLLFGFGLCAGEAAYGPKALEDTRLPVLIAAASLLSLALCLGLFPLTQGDLSTFGLHMPITDLFAGVLTAACLTMLGRSREHNTVVRWLSWKPLAGLGVMSYSLYLVHMPILIALNTLFLRYPIGMLSSPLFRVALLLMPGIPVILGLAYCFFLVVERPLLRR